jgi:hypothetical protein
LGLIPMSTAAIVAGVTTTTRSAVS